MTIFAYTERASLTWYGKEMKCGIFFFTEENLQVTVRLFSGNEIAQTQGNTQDESIVNDFGKKLIFQLHKYALTRRGLPGSSSENQTGRETEDIVSFQVPGRVFIEGNRVGAVGGPWSCCRENDDESPK